MTGQLRVLTLHKVPKELYGMCQITHHQIHGRLSTKARSCPGRRRYAGVTRAGLLLHILIALTKLVILVLFNYQYLSFEKQTTWPCMHN